MAIQKAVKYKHRIRLGLAGPTGSGKTMSALRIGQGIAEKEGGRLGVIDTEHGSASLYAEEFDFDVIELTSFAPDRYVEAIHEFEQAGGYAVIIVDSMTHAWNGKDGALEQVDKKAGMAGNSFTAWRDVTPQHTRLVEALLTCKAHLIVTLRSKMAYELDTDPRTKRTTVRKLGLQPIQRDGMEYEFDVFADIDVDNTLSISKTRNKALSGFQVQKAGESLGVQLWEWAEGNAAPTRPEPIVNEAAQERPGVITAGAPGRVVDASFATSPAPSPAFDQLGTFAKPDGSINMLAFGAELRRRDLSPKDLHGIVEPNAAGDGLDIRRWLKENPTRTLLQLTAMGACNRYGHEEPVFSEDPDAGMHCPRCNKTLDAEAGPPDHEDEEAAVQPILA